MRAIFFTFSPFYAHFGTILSSKKHKKSVEILWHRSISYNTYIIYGIKAIYRPAINFAFFFTINIFTGTADYVHFGNQNICFSTHNAIYLLPDSD